VCGRFGTLTFGDYVPLCGLWGVLLEYVTWDWELHRRSYRNQFTAVFPEIGLLTPARNIGRLGIRC